MAGVSERARASHAKDPWRSRTSGERSPTEKREGEARVEVEGVRRGHMEAGGEVGEEGT